MLMWSAGGREGLELVGGVGPLPRPTVLLMDSTLGTQPQHSRMGLAIYVLELGYIEMIGRIID